MILLPHVSSLELKQPCRQKQPVILSIHCQRRDHGQRKGQEHGGWETPKLQNPKRCFLPSFLWEFWQVQLFLTCVSEVPHSNSSHEKVWREKRVHMRWHKKEEPRYENITPSTSIECFNINRLPAKHLLTHSTVNQDGFQEIQLTWDFGPRHFNLSSLLS